MGTVSSPDAARPLGRVRPAIAPDVSGAQTGARPAGSPVRAWPRVTCCNVPPCAGGLAAGGVPIPGLRLGLPPPTAWALLRPPPGCLPALRPLHPAPSTPSPSRLGAWGPGSQPLCLPRTPQPAARPAGPLPAWDTPGPLRLGPDQLSALRVHSEFSSHGQVQLVLRRDLPWAAPAPRSSAPFPSRDVRDGDAFRPLPSPVSPAELSPCPPST